MFFYFPVGMDLPEPPKIEVKQIVEDAQESISFATYSDFDCLNKEINFSCGQKVFVRYELNIDYSGEGIVTLLDSDKKQLLSFELYPNAGVYKGSFDAPSSSGTFYVHFEIKDQSLAISAERNISVSCQKGEQSSQEVKSVSSAVTESFEDIIYSPTPESTSLATEIPAARITPASIFLIKIKSYFVKILRLFGLF